MYDLYVIGGRKGFYVGQALVKPTGGWARRIARHWSGHGGSEGALRLLVAGSRARCVGRVQTTKAFINDLEARAWDRFVAKGWKPVHPRPRDSANWNPGISPERRREISQMGGLARAKKLSKRRLQEIGQIAKRSRSSAERRACMLKTKPWLYKATGAKRHHDAVRAGKLGAAATWQHKNRRAS
jgi:hypothetical protein